MSRSLLLLLVLAAGGCALPGWPWTPDHAQTPGEKVCESILLPEQRRIDVHDPTRYPPITVPNNVPPRTVAHPRPDTPEWQLSLDEAIKIALENAEVVRVLAGTTATASGQTIYDAAITNTTIDQAQARFDPVLSDNAQWSRTNTPFAIPNPRDPRETIITSTPDDAFLNTLGVTKTNVLGGQLGLTWTENPMRFTAGAFGNNPATGFSIFPLNPETPSNVTLTYTQPLLQGGGYLVNVAPIVIARLNTEQSFFQYKDSVQELVRGVIEAYWNLVQARVAAWAVERQVDLSKEQYDREAARLQVGFSDEGTVAQARTSYNQFRANLVAAQANILTREGALRNILGVPPADDRRIVPVSAPASKRLSPCWDELVKLAETRRPDLVELKIILEADQVRLLQAKNQALPKLDLQTLYRWNGLEGIAPNGQEVETEPGQYTDWQVGINFSVPLGLRQGRALVRQSELTISRDRANVEQGMHSALHQLAATVRDLDSAYEQYLAFKETRVAADANVRAQKAKFDTGQTIYLSVLQAINDWGTAVTSEAQQLVNYNIALATLERQSGTILETHGLVFYEERYKAAGPLGIFGHGQLYPAATAVGGCPLRYPTTGQPAENSFDLSNPAKRAETPGGEVLPKPRAVEPGR
jgi:outer membrane protein TolC